MVCFFGDFFNHIVPWKPCYEGGFFIYLKVFMTKSFRNTILASALFAIGAAAGAAPAANSQLANPFKAGPGVKSLAISSSQANIGNTAVNVTAFPGHPYQYTIQGHGSYVSVTDNSTHGTQYIFGAVRMQFTGLIVAWNAWQTDGNPALQSAAESPAQVYRLYHAAFNRQPDFAGLGWFLQKMDTGASLADVAKALAGSQEMGVLTNEDFLNKVALNVMKRPLYYTEMLQELQKMSSDQASGKGNVDSRGEYLLKLSESQAHRTALYNEIANGVTYLQQ